MLNSFQVGRGVCRPWTVEGPLGELGVPARRLKIKSMWTLEIRVKEGHLGAHGET